MVGAWFFGCCWAHRGLLVGFLLLRYSVLFTVESLSLLYLLFISLILCSRRWCIDKLCVFHANQTSMCLVHVWTKGEVGVPFNWFKPSSKIRFTDRSKAVLLCGSFMLFLSCFVMLSCTSVCWFRVVTCWERADLLVLVCDFLLWHWCPGSGVVLDCIDSWFLPSFLLMLPLCEELFDFVIKFETDNWYFYDLRALFGQISHWLISFLLSENNYELKPIKITCPWLKVVVLLSAWWPLYTFQINLRVVSHSSYTFPGQAPSG